MLWKKVNSKRINKEQMFQFLQNLDRELMMAKAELRKWKGYSGEVRGCMNLKNKYSFVLLVDPEKICGKGDTAVLSTKMINEGAESFTEMD